MATLLSSPEVPWAVAAPLQFPACGSPKISRWGLGPSVPQLILLRSARPRSAQPPAGHGVLAQRLPAELPAEEPGAAGPQETAALRLAGVQGGLAQSPAPARADQACSGPPQRLLLRTEAWCRGEGLPASRGGPERVSLPRAVVHRRPLLCSFLALPSSPPLTQHCHGAPGVPSAQPLALYPPCCSPIQATLELLLRSAPGGTASRALLQSRGVLSPAFTLLSCRRAGGIVALSSALQPALTSFQLPSQPSLGSSGLLHLWSWICLRLRTLPETGMAACS